MQKKILWCTMLLYIIIWSAFSFWKYDQLLYNGLDLAIYNNVFWNTAHGNWFASSIHPPSYLGDHFEPLILPLSLLYRVLPDARFLLFLQTLALALAAIPLYFITKFFARSHQSGAVPLNGVRSPSGHGSAEGGERGRSALSDLAGVAKVVKRDAAEWWPLIIPILWLLNPFVANANIFEFHMLSLAPLFLFSMYYFYLQKRLLPFTIFTFLSLAVREDITLLVAAFGILFFIEWIKKNKSQSVAVPPHGVADGSGPPAGGAEDTSGRLYGMIAMTSTILWLFLSFSIISHYAPTGSYKFLTYYSWILTNPISGLFLHLAKPTVIAMVIGLLIPFLFIPILRPRFLLLALPPFLQFALTSGGGGSVVLQTHYALLFLPALFLSTIEVLRTIKGDLSSSPPPTVAEVSMERNECGGEGKARLSDATAGEREGASPAEAPSGSPTPERVAGVRGDGALLYKNILIPLLTTATLYSTLTMGPLLPMLKKIFINPPDQKLLQTKKEFLARIPENTPIATTYEFLTPLSARATVASLHYVFLGHKQYSEQLYELPPSIQTLLIDFDDFKTYQLQFAENPFYARWHTEGNDRIRTLINEQKLSPQKMRDGIALFTRNGDTSHTENVLTQMDVTKERGGLELDGIRSIIRVVDQ